jgi:thioredoxin-like negative regulator of GroEL
MTVSLAKDNMKNLEILRFTASWCGPCKQLEANLERADLGIDIKVMDIDEQEDVARQYNVRSVPTLVLLKNGEEFKRSVGSKTVNQLKDWVE